MKLKRRTILFFIAAGIIVGGCSSTIPPLGNAIVSKSFVLDKKPIALVYELRNYDASHLLYLTCLSQSFMKNGYTVLERFQLDVVMNELNLDQTGAVLDSVPLSSNNVSPSAIQGTSYLRIVDCESAEIVAAITVSAESMSAFDQTSADLLVIALEYASKEKDANGKAVPISITIQSYSVSEISYSYYGIQKMLFQKKIGPNYGWIYLPKEE